MTPRPLTRNALQAMALPLAVVALTVWQALPSLNEAWRDDLYSRGAPLACAIWLAPQVWWQIKNRHSPAPPGLAWIGLALLLCVTGAITELRVLQHLALASALTGAFGWRFSGLVTLATALAWIPATGWFLSHFKCAGLVGWERPAFASTLTICLLVRARFTRHASHATAPKP